MKPKRVAGIIQTRKAKSKHERVGGTKRSWYLEYWRERCAPIRGGGCRGRRSQLRDNTYAYVGPMITNVCPTNPQMTVMARQTDLRAIAQFRRQSSMTRYAEQDAYPPLEASDERCPLWSRVPEDGVELPAKYRGLLLCRPALRHVRPSCRKVGRHPLHHGSHCPDQG